MKNKKSLKEQLAERVYAVQVTVYVSAPFADEAQSYVQTALQEWSAKGRMIPALRVDSVEQSDLLFHNREAS
jgi:hypothetical protein